MLAELSFTALLNIQSRNVFESYSANPLLKNTSIELTPNDREIGERKKERECMHEYVCVCIGVHVCMCVYIYVRDKERNLVTLLY